MKRKRRISLVMSAVRSLVVLGIVGGAVTANAQIYVTYFNKGDGVVGAFNFDGSAINASLISGLQYPSGIASDGTGNLYVPNTGANVVGKYTTSGATVNAALISVPFPYQVVLDGHGFLYTVNEYLHYGKYTTTGWTVNASFITNYSGGGIPSIACDGDYLYLSDSYNPNIAKYTTSGVLVNASLISMPNSDGTVSIACDGNGNLFVANGNVISKYTTSGVLLNASLASSGNRPYFMALDGVGHLFIANFGSGTIGEFTTEGVTINASLISGLDEPSGVAVVIQPRLSIMAADANVILTWPTNASGLTLQSTTDLVSSVWTTNSVAPVVVNGLNTVTNVISGIQQFYRLSQ